MTTAELTYIVTQIKSLTATITQVFLQPKSLALSYQAGQYLEILYPTGEFQPFSIANAPQHDNRIELHIRHLPNDPATLDFLHYLQNKQQATIRGPFGSCVYTKLPKPIIFLAAGTGFAQAKAIIEKTCAINSTTFLHLYWGVKTTADFYLTDALMTWQEKLPHFCYTLVLSQADKHWTGELGYVHEKAVRDYPALSHYQVYASGPLPMVLASLKLMETHGLNRRYFYSDMLNP